MQKSSLFFALLLGACSNPVSNPNNANNPTQTGDDDGVAGDTDVGDDDQGGDNDPGDTDVPSDEDVPGDTDAPGDTDEPLGDPTNAGPCTSTTFSSSVESSTDGLQIPVDVFVPAGVAGPYPLVVINHGFQLSADKYQGIAEHFASWCYVAVLNDYPTSLFGTSHAQVAQDITDVTVWAKGEGASQLVGKVDDTRVVLVGHSLGGKAGFLANLGTTPIADVLIGLDPVDAGDPSLAPEQVGDIDVPVLLLGETNNGSGGLFGQNCAPLDNNYQQYYAALPTGLPVLEVTFAYANHNSWLDDPGCFACLACSAPDNVDHDGVKRLSRRYMIAFAERHLSGITAFETYLSGASMTADIATGAVSKRSK